MDSPSLSSLGNQALSGFRTLVSTAPDLENLCAEHQRFLLWSASLGLTSQSSLDHRLRNAELIRKTVAYLLAELCDCVAALKEIYSGVRAPYEVARAADTHLAQHTETITAEPVESSSESDSESESSTGTTSDEGTVSGEAETRLDELTDIIDKLYKFAVDIRNSATRSGPGDRNPFRKFSIEEQRDIILQLSRYEELLIDRHIRQARESSENIDFQAPPEDLSLLKSRCGRSNVLRRQYFNIWQERHQEEKKVLNEPQIADAPNHHSKSAGEDEADKSQQPVQEALMQPSTIAPSVQRTVTTLDPARIIRPRATGSSYSRASRTAPSREPGGEKPPWPRIDQLPKTEYFQCPYCFLICPERYRESDHAWRAHLIQDLRPYMCTYPQCESEEQLYQNRTDWENHEKYVHRKIWRCPDHVSEEMSQSEYVEHVQTEHLKYSSQMLSDEALRAAESTPLEYERPCPFCSKTFDTCEDIEHHITYHLECIALLTLPQMPTADDDFGSESANLVEDSRFSDSQLSIWKIDDNVGTTTNESSSGVGLDLNADVLGTHQSQFHASAEKVDLIATWRSFIDKEALDVEGGVTNILETAIRDRTSKENARAGQLLAALYYVAIHQRMDSIVEAHKGTFEWIWTNSLNSHASSFLEFLEHGNGLFWISGKAASGKSTLMKYIVQHHRTEEALRKWAGNARLLMSSFYFWRAGSTIQKSPTGMLRSLLYQMLSAAPDLVSTVMPVERDSVLQEERSSDRVDYERELLDLQIEMKEALERKDAELVSLVGARRTELERKLEPQFEKEAGLLPETLNILQQDDESRFIKALTENRLKIMLTKLVSLPSLRVVLFIDGLDEYDGDRHEIVIALNFFVKAGAKVVATSRPHTEFVDAFADTKGFRLQDHTRADIDLYVRNTFFENRGFRQLSEHEPMAIELTSEIVEKAGGVFLWVVLVTRSLIRGISDFDTFGELRRRLDELPPDLDYFYDYSFESIHPMHRRQRSELFQMMSFHANTCAGLPLPALLLQFLDFEHGSEHNLSPIRSITAKEKLMAVEMVQRRIDTCSGGMIEVSQSMDQSSYRLHEPIAVFSHDTVREYLQQEHVRDQITDEHGSDWSPAHVLFNSSIQWIRSYATSEDFRASVSSDGAGPIDLVRTLATQYLRFIKPTSESYHQDLLNNFEHAVQMRSNLESGYATTPAAQIVSAHSVILVMGAEGSGKSSFINLFPMSSDKGYAGSSLLRSEPADVELRVFRSEPEAVSPHLPGKLTLESLLRTVESDGPGIVSLLEVPPFANTISSDTEILVKFASLLTVLQARHITVAGIFYLHDVCRARMDASARRSLHLLKSICGAAACNNIVLATTKWNELDDEKIATGFAREKELIETDSLWGALIRSGSRVIRVNGDGSAIRESLATMCQGGSINLKIEVEMFLQGKKLQDTEVGSELCSELTRAAQEKQAELQVYEATRSENYFRVHLLARKSKDEDRLRKQLEQLRADLHILGSTRVDLLKLYEEFGL